MLEFLLCWEDNLLGDTVVKCQKQLIYQSLAVRMGPLLVVLHPNPLTCSELPQIDCFVLAGNNQLLVHSCTEDSMQLFRILSSVLSVRSADLLSTRASTLPSMPRASCLLPILSMQSFGNTMFRHALYASLGTLITAVSILAGHAIKFSPRGSRMSRTASTRPMFYYGESFIPYLYSQSSRSGSVVYNNGITHLISTSTV